ncbi:MAG TPA: dienelactone hydrolase family protein [Candidatus Limnocylindrales bacterium]|jgi:carboxymethylenebutenolidase
MCFDHDSRPPIPPIAGGALDSASITLTAGDGNRFMAFGARAAEPSGAGVVILPDVRGLHAYYRELALRFAEHGIDAVAIDYFGRTAGLDPRGAGFDHAPHIGRTTHDGLTADLRAGLEHLRSEDGGGVRNAFTIGFCFGGRLAFYSGALGLGLTGVIGFYGWPAGAARNGIPAPVDFLKRMDAAVLGIFGEADEGIPPPAVAAFEAGLEDAGVDHRVITYPGAPHSFFDRKADDYAEASRLAWEEVLAFVRTHRRTAAGGG